MSDTITLQNSKESLVCGECLRNVPGKRSIYKGKYQEQEVIIKVFFGKINAKRRMHRELAGIKELDKRKITTPLLLFSGKTLQGNWCIITKYISFAENASDLWTQSPTIESKKQILQKIIAVLAEHHRQKIQQMDLHIGNFLISENDVFTLDPAQIKFQYFTVSRAACLKNLAILAAQYSEISPYYFLKVYARCRQWSIDCTLKKNFCRETTRISRKRIKKILRKYLRKNTRHYEVVEKNLHAIVDKTLCEYDEIIDFINKISQVDKEIFYYNKQQVSVTRFSNKSQALKNWCNSHHLQLLNFEHPTPLAYVKTHNYSYVVSEHISYEKFYNYLENSKVEDKIRTTVVRKAIKFLDIISQKKIIHQDIYNNLVANDEAVFFSNVENIIFYNEDMFTQIYQSFYKQICRSKYFYFFEREQHAENNKGIHS
ncbi:lipopolysaccharide kinase InaA family protein [Candidatus Uabimicrobium sp. HlEnr_7]|uniref:lipopolysaccharide kinase InaA family protein n=1 Tax=Candidatus Uabimicrobium helgolandensis TaxID=3095367 RepID=UPI003556D70B